MNRERILQCVEEIEARAARATPGPWESDGVRIYSYHSKCKYGLVADCDLELAIKGAEPQLPYDPDFIAHARTDVPLLCQIVRQLVARLEKLERVAGAARELLKVLPDSANGEDWEWAWDQLYADSQERVKEARERAQEALVALDEQSRKEVNDG